jgi:hypothetical protein
MWRRYVTDMGNCHGWTLTSWVAALSAAPSRIRLSRRRIDTGFERRYQTDKVYQLVLAIQLRARQGLPTAASPALVPMRPDPPHDPTVDAIEELSERGLACSSCPIPE